MNKLMLLLPAVIPFLGGCDNKSTPVRPPPPEVKVHDPGVRLGNADAGGTILDLPAGKDLSEDEKKLVDNFKKLFDAGKKEFVNVDTVKEDGLGPTFNLNSCGVGCHMQPAFGGSSPGPTKDNPKPINPQYTFWKDNYPTKANKLPSFILGDEPKNPGFSPVREARFIYHIDDQGRLDKSKLEAASIPFSR